MKDIAPSPEQRTQFCHRPERSEDSTHGYERELSEDPVRLGIADRICDEARRRTVTPRLRREGSRAPSRRCGTGRIAGRIRQADPIARPSSAFSSAFSMFSAIGNSTFSSFMK